MSCRLGKSLPWVLHREDLRNVYSMLQKKFESAGILTFKKKNKIMQISKPNKIIEGSRSSVETPLDIVNYHVHPYQCYIDEEVIWGWPSGEDLRQSIIFALGGNLAHLVVCVEGIYVIEVNPCFLSFIKKMSSEERSIIIAWIELMGKSTHELRTLEVNKVKKIDPKHWIKFVNNLKVNLSKTEECGIITCNTVTVFNNNSIVLNTLEKYLDNMYYSVELDTYTKKGVYLHSKKINKTKYVSALTKVRSEKFKCGKKLLQNKKWKKGHIFNVKLFRNDEFPKDEKPNDIFKWIQTKPKLEPPIKTPIIYRHSITKQCNLKQLQSKIE